MRNKGFTLVELLIVITIVGVLSAGVVASINIISKINSANLANAKTFAASVENNLSISQVGKWSFEEGSGIIAKDTSGYGNDGTLNGTTKPTWTTAATCGLGIGGCLNFDGLSGYVNFNNSAILNAGNFTWVAWINLKSLPSSGQSMAIILDWNGDGGKTFHVQNAGGVLGLWAEVRTTVPSTISISPGDGAYNFQTNQWYFVVFQYNGTNLKTFVNGLPQVTKNIGLYALQTNSGSAYIGSAWGSSRFFNGLIDEVAIYNQALGLSQIQQLYAQGLVKYQLAKN